ncbi:MAG: hypothetical protein Kow0092_11560 [Deferrisomatales bacterium]
MDIICWDIGTDRPVTPTDPLPTMPACPPGALLVIGGRAPVWRYGLALHRAHASPAWAVATYDPRLGAVVVAAHGPGWTEGQVLPLDWEASRA